MARSYEVRGRILLIHHIEQSQNLQVIFLK